MKIPDLPENYSVVSLLGKSSYGESYLVYDQVAGKNKVIKIINDHYLWREMIRHKDILCKIESNYIVRTYDINVYNSNRFIEQEYIQGLTLSKFIFQENLFLDDFINISLSFFNAMLHLSKLNLSHKDIKPSNIIYNRKKGVAKIIDIDYLGIFVSSVNNFIGTVKFSSPEQATKNRHSIGSDIYSFGLVMCLMIMGDIPFDIDYKKTNSELKEKLPLFLNEAENIDQDILDKILSFILSALAYEPELRITPEKAMNEIQQIKDMSVDRAQGTSILRKRNTFNVFDKNFGESVLMKSIILSDPSALEDKGDLDIHDLSSDDSIDNWDKTHLLPKSYQPIFMGSAFKRNKNMDNDKTINKNFYRKHLLKEYDNILFQAEVSFWLWFSSFIIFFVLIAVSVICIIQGKYIEGLVTIAIDSFVLAIQKLFNIREDHYRKLIEQKMTHLETGDYLESAFAKVKTLDSQQERNKEIRELIRVIRQRAELNKAS